MLIQNFMLFVYHIKNDTVEPPNNVLPINGNLLATANFQFTEFFFNKFLPYNDQPPYSD